MGIMGWDGFGWRAERQTLGVCPRNRQQAEGGAGGPLQGDAYTQARVRMITSAHAHTHTQIPRRTYTHTHTHASNNTHTPNTLTHTHKHSHTHTHTHVNEVCYELPRTSSHVSNTIHE